MRSTTELIILVLLAPLVILGLGVACVAVHMALQRKSQERRATLYAEKERAEDDDGGRWARHHAAVREEDLERAAAAVFRPRREGRGVVRDLEGWSVVSRAEDWV